MLVSFVISICIYCGLIFVFLLSANKSIKPTTNTQNNQIEPIVITLEQFAKQNTKQLITREPLKQTTLKQQQKVRSQHMSSTTKQTIKKSIKKSVNKIAPIKKAKTQSATNQQAVKRQTTQQTKAIKQTAKDDDAIIAQENTKEKQIAFFNHIKTMIDSKKTYPKMPLKRKIQGSVKVKIEISQQGKLVNILQIKGHKIFHNSIKESIKSIFPLQSKNGLFLSNQIIEFEIVYAIIH